MSQQTCSNILYTVHMYTIFANFSCDILLLKLLASKLCQSILGKSKVHLLYQQASVASLLCRGNRHWKDPLSMSTNSVVEICKFTAHDSPHAALEYCDCHLCQMMWTFLINIEKAKIGSQMISLLRRMEQSGFQHRLFRIYATQILYGLVASDRFHFNETSWIQCPFPL